MQIHRCPECGNRLTSNYCDICMRRVPFAGLRSGRNRDPWDSSSAHREEADHTCVSFDTPDPPKTAIPKPVFPKRKQADKKKPALVIFLAVMSLIGLLGDLQEEFSASEPVPEYNAEAFAPDEELPVIQPETIQAGDGITITSETLGLYYEEPSLSFIVENQSEQDIEVVVEEVAVNGCMIDTGMLMEVPAGEACQGFLCLYALDLEKFGISEISRVDVRLRVNEQEDYREVFYLDRWTLYTDAADHDIPPIDDSGRELYNDGSTRVLLRGITLSSSGDGELELFIENRSGSDVTVYTGDVFLNGQKAENYLGGRLMSGTCSIRSIYLSDLEALEIDAVSQIEEVTFTLQVDYMDGWDIVESHSETVVLSDLE